MTSYVFGEEKGSSCHLIDMFFKGEVAVENHSEVACVFFAQINTKIIRGLVIHIFFTSESIPSL